METLRRCVRAARSRGAKPEHVVLLINDAWDHYDHCHTNSEQTDKLLRLTGAALKAYFAAD